jgi:hypothetical protein
MFKLLRIAAAAVFEFSLHVAVEQLVLYLLEQLHLLGPIHHAVHLLFAYGAALF